MRDFGDFIVFLDESGDHSLVSIDKDFPIFALAFVIVRKTTYARDVAVRMKEFKFRFWGHDCAILHAHEIRKPRGDFAFLQVEENRVAFLSDLNDLMTALDIAIVAVVIRKDKLARQYRKPYSPYHIALGLGLERVCAFLVDQGQEGKLTHVVAESRGDKEDDDLELEFRRIMDGQGSMGSAVSVTPFELRFEPKRANIAGMQIADLVAHPIARHVLKPDQTNRAFDIIQPRFVRDRRGTVNGHGLKVFP